MSLATVIGCLMVLAIVGVILKLVLDDIGGEGRLPVLFCYSPTEGEHLSAVSQGYREKIVLARHRILVSNPAQIGLPSG